jgi:hypothetical protein
VGEQSARPLADRLMSKLDELTWRVYEKPIAPLA